ncbi:hypothetical protein BD626DRAFT_59521 [Schizophyllum amplum]|uniref:Uncharacterized protein n=1 Tax=Schizophyllum amplum TaxID=97359 RepID=A0A550CBW8_9AGAR|nr:hypothetical protein BD626DRAFT_59521 [Auriculariopsis ampla]
MVASKTTKATKAKAPSKAKYTYRERVLDACSTLQHEHRKGSRGIHMASLRAQVHKAAEARGDKMGPHSNTYIAKAVKDLTAEGMLEHCPEPATVQVTPQATKTFTAARKSLNLATGPPTSPAAQEMFIRLVSHSPRKRSRPSGVHFGGSGADDADVGDSISAPVKRPRRSTGRPRKSKAALPSASRAPRRSMGTQAAASQGPKALTRMTKAELLAKIEELTERQQALRSDSPLTQMSDDEDGHDATEARLREQSQHYRERIEALEQQLTLGSASAVGGLHNIADRGNTMDTDDQPTRPSTPVEDMPTISPPSTPAAEAQSQPQTQAKRLLGASRVDPRAPLGMSRTQSGSFISHLSKRPTPAPSEPGDDHHADIDMAQYEPSQDAGSQGLSPSQESAYEVSQAERDALIKMAGLEQQLATMNQELVDVRSASAAAELRLQRSTQALEDKVIAREQIINSLEADIENARCRVSDMESMIAAKDQELDQLQGKREQATAEYEAARVVAAQQEQILRDTADELQETLVSRDTTVSEQQCALADLNARMAAAMATRDELTLALATADAERVRLFGELEGTLTAKMEVQRQFREQLQALQDAVVATEKDMQELETDRDRLRSECDRLQAVADAYETEVARLNRDIEEERERVAATTAQVADRDAQLTVKARQADELQAQLKAFVEQISTLEGKVWVTQARVEELEYALGSSREETTSAAKERDAEASKAVDLRMRVDIADESNKQLRDAVAERDARLAAISTDLETSLQQHNAVLDELATVNKLAETEKARKAALEDTLQQTKVALSSAQSEVGSLRAAKHLDEQTIAHLKKEFAKYRAQQTKWLSELSNEVDTAQASTVSVKIVGAI